MTTVPIEIITKAVELYKSGLPLIKASANAGISYECLRRKLKTLGLIRSNKINSRKYALDETFFHEIDTERKAYWLGFIYADGYVSRGKTNQKCVGIALKSKERPHLEQFRRDIQATYPIGTYTTDSYGMDVEYVRILMTSTQMFDDLVSKGVLEHKSLILTFPNATVVPPALLHHFIRGYFDGDGSFARSKKDKEIYTVKILGTKEFLNELSSKMGFPNRTLRKRHKKSHKNNWTLEIGGRKQVVAVGDYMYRDATMFMKRKWQRYLTAKTLTPLRINELGIPL